LRNAEIAKAIGTQPSMVYKIKSGKRFPSFKIMLNIEKRFGWSVNEQIAARREGVYHDDFDDYTSTIK
jgi:ribosome-binding protein aMBF1 (putative translation factor)